MPLIDDQRGAAAVRGGGDRMSTVAILTTKGDPPDGTEQRDADVVVVQVPPARGHPAVRRPVAGVDPRRYGPGQPERHREPAHAISNERSVEPISSRNAVCKRRRSGGRRSPCPADPGPSESDRSATDDVDVTT